MTHLPSRLAAPPAGWTTYADVVVIGSGIAGLTAALQARTVGSVLVVTKDNLSEVIDAGWVTKADVCAGVTAGSVVPC